MVAFTQPISWAYDAAGLNEYKYNPDKARQLLEQDGWAKGADGIYQKNGQKLEFTLLSIAGGKIFETLAQVATQQYQQIGIKVTPKLESREALNDRLFKSKDPKYGEQGGHDYDAAIYTLPLGADPGNGYSNWHSSQIKNGLNIVGYRNDVVDSALEDSRTHCGTTERKAAFQKMNRQLNEDQPFNFGWGNHSVIYSNKRLQGLDPGGFPNPPRGLVWNIEKWRMR